MRADGQLETETYWDFPRERKSEKEISPGDAAQGRILRDMLRSAAGGI